MPQILMPRLSDQMEEGTVIKWLVDDGVDVSAGDELVEIETDKATMSYPSESEGTLRILAAEGTTVPVGEPIAEVGEGELPAPDDADERPPTVRPDSDARELDAPSARSETARGGAPATPLARRAATVHQVGLSDLVGSGPGGRVTKRDVLRAAGVTEETPPRPAASPAHRPVTSSPAVADTRTVQPSRLQQRIAERMAGQALVPVFQVQTDVVMDPALALRAELKQVATDRDAIPSVNDFILRACALGLRSHDLINGSYQHDAYRINDRVHIGFAVATDAGLLVPTVRDTDQKTLGQIAHETQGLAKRARAGNATAEELSGATFTVSNLGMFGMTEIVPVINPPQAAILGVGATRPVLRRDESGDIVDQTVAALTLSCDHRILNGADGARFLQDVRALLETPLRLAL